jgi:3-methyladenine DNA glycosylase AlkD
MNAATPEDLVAYIRAELAARVDEAFRAGAARFFKETIDLWGVRTVDLQRIIRSAAAAARKWPSAECERFAELLWQSGKFEEGVIAIHVLRRFAKRYGAREFCLFEGWISRYVHNWAHADGVASWLLAASIANDPALAARLPAWTRSRNRWKRRSAAVAFLQEAKAGRHTEAILDVADRLAEDTDDMVRKGLGWLLKESYPRRPGAIIEWLAANKHRLARLVLRLAAEKMTPAHRQALMG